MRPLATSNQQLATMHLAQIGAPFIPHWPQLRPFVAEMWLIATIVAVLITPFFTRKSNITCALVALAGLAAALLSLLVVASHPVEIRGPYLRGLLVSDEFAILWKVMLVVFVAGI